MLGFKESLLRFWQGLWDKEEGMLGFKAWYLHLHSPLGQFFTYPH